MVHIASAGETICHDLGCAVGLIVMIPDRDEKQAWR
jgi:hypothetical protein